MADERPDDTVTSQFTAVAVIKTARMKMASAKGKLNYTNLRCNACGEWWIMVALDKDSVYCPWCGAVCKPLYHMDDPTKQQEPEDDGKEVIDHEDLDW